MPISGDLLSNAMAGLAFIGCAMGSVAPTPAPAAQTRRREAVVNGKRVKTVDVHAHCIVPKAAAVIKHPLESPGLLMADTSTRHRRDGRARHRCRGVEYQPVLVPRRTRRRRRADQNPE